SPRLNPVHTSLGRFSSILHLIYHFVSTPNLFLTTIVADSGPSRHPVPVPAHCLASKSLPLKHLRDIPDGIHRALVLQVPPNAPATPPNTPPPTDQIIVSLTANREYYLNKEKVDPQNIAIRLQEV